MASGSEFFTDMAEDELWHIPQPFSLKPSLPGGFFRGLFEGEASSRPASDAMLDACMVPLPSLGLWTDRLKTLVFGSKGADALRRAEQRMLEGIKTKVRCAGRK